MNAADAIAERMARKKALLDAAKPKKRKEPAAAPEVKDGPLNTAPGNADESAG